MAEQQRPTQLYVKPGRKGLLVRHPQTGEPLPETGQWVANTAYWRRRATKGDVVEATPPKPARPTKAAAASTLTSAASASATPSATSGKEG